MSSQLSNKESLRKDDSDQRKMYQKLNEWKKSLEHNIIKEETTDKQKRN